MATYEFKNLADQYENFSYPIAVIEVNNKDIAKNDLQLVINQIEVELTSGFEASIASFNIYNSFDTLGSKFLYKEVKDYICIGSKVSIALGYANVAKKLFVGVITKINFIFDQDNSPYIHVTAMDVKGIMMSGTYAQKLKAKSYGEAVKEVLEKTAYSKLVDKEIISEIAVTDTPDKQETVPGAGNIPSVPSVPSSTSAAGGEELDSSDYTIDMVNESDYEFVVRAAKRFDYEFFTQCGTVLFRRAKEDGDVLMELRSGQGLYDFDVEYDITGIVSEIEARGMDSGKGKVISAKQKFSNSVSNGNRAKSLIEGSRKVYIDPTIKSTEDAQYRAISLMEEMSYRFGSLTCTVQGMPELIAGKFIAIKDLGGAVSNHFYVTEARHVLSPEGYFTYIKGKAAGIGSESGDLLQLNLSGLSSMIGGGLGNLAGGLSAAAGALNTVTSVASTATSAASAVGGAVNAAGSVSNIASSISGLGGIL